MVGSTKLTNLRKRRYKRGVSTINANALFVANIGFADPEYLCARKNEPHMKRITFPFIESDCKIPVIKFTCDEGHELYALVDTGSEATLLEKEVVKEYPKFNSETKESGIQSMVGVSGETKVPATCAHIRVGVDADGEDSGYLEFDGTILCFGDLQESFKKRFGRPIALLVGSDFMTRHNAKINMKKRSISLLVKNDSKGMNWSRIPA